MNADFIRRQNDIDRRLKGVERLEVGQAVISSFLGLPGLVGFWPMSSVQRSTGNAYDLSGQGRTLTYNGNPTYNIYNNFVPYIDFDGTGDYLSRADETDLDILGTETINATAVMGLTVAGWFWLDTAPGANGYGLVSKYLLANQLSYLLYVTSGLTSTFGVSNTGSAVVSIASTEVLATSTWYFLAGVYVPSTSITTYVNNTARTSVSSVPASLFNSTTALEIGRYNGGNNLDGRAALVVLSHQAYSSSLINTMFQESRILFGV